MKLWKSKKKLCITTQFCGDTFFAPRNGEMGENLGVLNLMKNLVINFHSIYSILKIFIFIWEKSCFWDKGQNRLSQSDCRISKWTISLEQIDESILIWPMWSLDSNIELTNGINFLDFSGNVFSHANSGHHYLTLHVWENSVK